MVGAGARSKAQNAKRPPYVRDLAGRTGPALSVQHTALGVVVVALSAPASPDAIFTVPEILGLGLVDFARLPDPANPSAHALDELPPNEPGQSSLFVRSDSSSSRVVEDHLLRKIWVERLPPDQKPSPIRESFRTMPRGKRGVKFPHKANNGNADGRRSSFSDYSEDGSPIRQRSGSGQQAPLDGIAEQPQLSPAEAAAEEKRVAHEKRKTDFKVRTFWTFVMFAGFFAALFSGHMYIICVMTVIQVVCFKEVIAIASVPSRARQLRPSKSLNWYWLVTTMYFLYGESVIYYFKHIVLVDKVLLPLATHHRFISFFLYIFGFVFFVTTLHAGHFKFQFTQFAWTHMALYLIVVQAHFVMNNVFEGLIWFFLPAALVITNDIFAYIVGMTFGRTQLIKLSPKKTVEGFVGAWVFTIVFGIILANILTRSSYFICPAHVS
ncbi:phosphatidate cytidylyltransferase [Verticillium alfalfae VaMs.102]|uniref:phosphatidate cytidylyltransferase n=1 Tax=Verticillium alfalfae (strain VaMs.102 / ATCC MYA-4576 / FGSC 10136) TaxID=526221 RepID=C9SUF1_VERA1|nr:phosphatidate cytidylyltransferase [Verticillium alfalfae VaMs.102]EEY22462.1 phosphatidate cytidylyltransferase [Verticillium alfalfae VaMs.102]